MKGSLVFPLTFDMKSNHLNFLNSNGQGGQEQRASFLQVLPERLEALHSDAILCSSLFL